MKIFINAATLRVGGGRSVGINFLNALKNLKTDDKYIIVVPDDPKYKNISSINFRFYFVPKFYHIPFFRLILDRWILKIVKKSKPDRIFNMGNIALPTKKYKQITLFHFPYAVYPESKVWKKMRAKDYIVSKLMVFLFKKRLKYTDVFLVQTQTVKKRMVDIYNFSEKNIFLAPNAVSLDNLKNKIIKDDNIQEKTKDKSTYKLLCLSVYYPHKNIEILLEVAKIIKKRRLKIQIFTTLLPNENKKVKKFLYDIERYDLGDFLINLGRIKMENIAFLYSRIDALILPTSLESFTGTYVESMFFRKRILTSNMDFAKEICVANSWFFNQEDPIDILDKIIESMKANNINEEEKAYDYVLSMKNWTQVSEQILNVIKA